ncbi:hypothetical protein [Altererythrobacter fulvus]|uniref:hypothetical protein n=1 Tax=Caenibius fulvus TaxID=2126012 RepID=UPI00301AFFC7
MTDYGDEQPLPGNCALKFLYLVSAGYAGIFIHPQTNEIRRTFKKVGAVAPTLFGAIKLLVNNQTTISEFSIQGHPTAIVKTMRSPILAPRGF